MKKSLIILALLAGTVCFTGCNAANNDKTTAKILGMPNPWSDCGKDFECAQKASGITFPVANFNVRAMKGMTEVVYPLDNTRTLIVRKVIQDPKNTDMSGVYINYPINKEIKLDNDVSFKIRGTKEHINVAYLSSESGYYSFYCEKGFSKKELEKFYNILAEFETVKNIP